MNYNPTQKYNFKFEVDQFGFNHLDKDFFDRDEIILIEKFEKLCQIIKIYDQKKYKMIELGCNQCFYSLFFKFILGINNTNTVLVEPYKPFLERGKRNFHINGLDCEIINKCVGRKKWLGTSSPDYEFDVELTTLNELMCGDTFDILHSDIDGNELYMLLENKDIFQEKKIKNIFLLTHGGSVHFNEMLENDRPDTTHYKCKEFFTNTEYKLIYECEEWEVGGDSLLIYSIDENVISSFQN
jgi:hypothetical protein